MRNRSGICRTDRLQTDLGFTLIEVLLVTIIVSILASMAMPQVQRALEKAKVAAAIGDIDAIGWDIVEYELGNGVFPNSLAEVGWGARLDPWGNPYEYLKIQGGPRGRGAMRKDRFLVPINSDFDLYSMGPDGKSASPLTAKISQDDIVRANDGGFVGVAADY